MTAPSPTYQDPNAPGFGAPPQAPQPTKRGGGFGKKILIRLGVVVLLFGAWFVYDQVTGAPDTAKVGDCVQNSGTDANPDVHVIGCSDAKAKYKVLQTFDGTTDDSKCTAPGYEFSYTETGGNSSDLLLCLGLNK